MDIKAATDKDFTRILEFEKQLRQDQGLSEMEIAMQSWDEPWREESLTHYLKGGWCFVAELEGRIQGYILCQPLLFFRSYTQSLWIEFVSGVETPICEELADIAWRWARSKHLQKVYFNSKFIKASFLQEKFSDLKTDDILHLSSTKISEK